MFGPKEENLSNNSCFESKTEWYQEFRIEQSKKNSRFQRSKPKLLAQESFKKLPQFANHLKMMVDESIEWIEKVFKIGLASWR
jgi:hypothetical protein